MLVLQVYFKIQNVEYKFHCSKSETMKNVLIRFCQQYKFNKNHFYFIHNNHLLDENSTYDKLFPDQYKKRIINVDPKSKAPNDISSRGSRDSQLVNMQSIISKINDPNIIKQDYKDFYSDEGIISNESEGGYYKIHKARRKTFEEYAIKIFDFNNIFQNIKILIMKILDKMTWRLLSKD